MNEYCIRIEYRSKSLILSCAKYEEGIDCLSNVERASCRAYFDRSFLTLLLVTLARERDVN